MLLSGQPQILGWRLSRHSRQVWFATTCGTLGLFLLLALSAAKGADGAPDDSEAHLLGSSEWVRTGTAGDETGAVAKSFPDGYVYMAFTAEMPNSLDDGGNDFAYTSVTSSENYIGQNVYVRKYSSDLSTVLWTRAAVQAGGESVNKNNKGMVPRNLYPHPTDSTLGILFIAIQTQVSFWEIYGETRYFVLATGVMTPKVIKEETNAGFNMQLWADAGAQMSYYARKYSTDGLHLQRAVDGQTLWEIDILSSFTTLRNPVGPGGMKPDSGGVMIVDSDNQKILYVSTTGLLLWQVAPSSSSNSNTYYGPPNTLEDKCKKAPAIHLEEAYYADGRRGAGFLVHPFSGTVSWGGFSVTRTGTSTDIAVMHFRYDTSGMDVVWLSKVGSGNQDGFTLWAESPVVVHPQHGVYIAGFSKSAEAPYSHFGNTDWWFYRLNMTDGSVIARVYGGSSANDYFTSVYFDATSNNPPLVTAISNGAIGRADSGTLGGYDVLIGYLNFTTGCPSGAYRTGSPACTEAPQGYWTETLDQTHATLCPAGSATNRYIGADQCNPCPVGHFSPTDGSFECTPCPTGSYQDTTGAMSCKLCGQGTYAETTGASGCTECSTGTYQSEEGQSSCIECPNDSTTISTSSISLDLCICVSGQYGDPTSSSDPRACKTCPTYTTCGNQQLWPAPYEGYFVSVESADTAVACMPAEACSPGGEVDYCADGYSGYGCTDCADGHFREGAYCKDCGDIIRLQTIILVVVTISGLLALGVGIGVFVGVVVVCTLRRNKSITMRSIPTVLKRGRNIVYALKFIQVLAIVLSLDLPWPKPILAVKAIVIDVNSLFSVWNMIPVECMVSVESPVFMSQMYLTCILLIVALLATIMASMLLLQGALRLLSTRPPGPVITKISDIMANTVNVMITVANLMYLPMHSAIVSVFSCYEQKAGVYRMVWNPQIQCFVSGGEWLGLAMFGIILFLVVSIGYYAFVVAAVGATAKYRRDHQFQNNFGPLFLLYRPQLYYFEVVAMAEKFLLPLGSLFMFMTTVKFQTMWLLAITMVFTFLTVQIQQQVSREEHLWCVCTGVCTMIVIAVASTIQKEGGAESSAGVATTNAVLVGIFLMASCVMLGLLMYTVINMATCNRCSTFMECKRARSLADLPTNETKMTETAPHPMKEPSPFD